MKKVNIQQFLGCLPCNFWERIEFDMPKNLDITLHKARIFYENVKLRHENINRSWYRSRTFSENRKPSFKPPPYRKQNNNFPVNRKFNETCAKPNVPAPNTNRLVENRGTEASLLQVNYWKFQVPHYARDFPNKNNGVLHNLHEYSMVEDMDRTPRIYASLDGLQVDHPATMVEI